MLYWPYLEVWLGLEGKHLRRRRGGREQDEVYLCVACRKVGGGVQLLEGLRGLVMCRMAAALGPWPGLARCAHSALMHLLGEKAFPGLHSA